MNSSTRASRGNWSGGVYNASAGMRSSELQDCKFAAKQAGFAAEGVLANPFKMGLPPDRCDAIMARMVYHMIDAPVARDVYLPQIARALRRNGRLLITDHGPSDNCVTTRKGAALGGMAVVPLLQEIREFTAAGLALVQRWTGHTWTTGSAYYGST